MGSRPEQEKSAGTQIYRIVSSQYSPFDGGGAYQWGSRWVDPGRLVIHGAASYSLAVLENLVHWQSSELPPTLVCVIATIPKSVKQAKGVPRNILDKNQCRTVGNRWFDAGKTAVLWIPSVVSPYEDNVLINQRHPEFRQIQVSDPVGVSVDKRLMTE